MCATKDLTTKNAIVAVERVASATNTERITPKTMPLYAMTVAESSTMPNVLAFPKGFGFTVEKLSALHLGTVRSLVSMLNKKDLDAKHFCAEMFCKTCEEWVSQNYHFCYLKPPKYEPALQILPRHISFDYETWNKPQGGHTPSTVIAQCVVERKSVSPKIFNHCLIRIKQRNTLVSGSSWKTMKGALFLPTTSDCTMVTLSWDTCWITT